eukprot:6786749-Karenia_brevis.AAC.1
MGMMMLMMTPKILIMMVVRMMVIMTVVILVKTMTRMTYRKTVESCDAFVLCCFGGDLVRVCKRSKEPNELIQNGFHCTDDLLIRLGIL